MPETRGKLDESLLALNGAEDNSSQQRPLMQSWARLSDLKRLRKKEGDTGERILELSIGGLEISGRKDIVIRVTQIADYSDLPS